MPDKTNSAGNHHPLFAPLDPLATGLLPVGDGHEIYFEQSGNLDGQPLLFLHGGPGSGLNRDQGRLFDPTRFHIIQFDQRGCGKSTPHGSLQHNTTAHLVADIKKLLDHLRLERVHLAGGSWGSTLALAFAVAHPKRVHSLLLYGIFLCRPRELRALYFKDGLAHQIYPELFEQYLALLPAKDQDDPIRGYKKLFTGKDESQRNQALLMWTRLEKQLSRLIVEPDELANELADPDFILSHSLIENHYFLAKGFIDADQLLQEAGRKLADMALHIIAGRYDLICPLITAHELHKALPRSTLEIVPDAGHSFREAGITDALIRAGAKLT